MKSLKIKFNKLFEFDVAHVILPSTNPQHAIDYFGH